MVTLEDAFAAYCGLSTPKLLPPELTWPFATISAKVASQQRVEPNGNVARSLRQTSCYFALARWLRRRRPGPLNICEIGFNIGHSATVFLTAVGTSARYVGFELSARRYVTSASKVLNGSGLFPGRVELVYGDSLTSAPRFLAEHPRFRCDLLSVDGDHTIEHVLGDWRSFKSRLQDDHVVLFDDISHHHPIFTSRKRRDPDLHLVGCLRLNGEADDEESLRLFQMQRARRRNVTRPLTASDAFCVARRVTAADAVVRKWTVKRTPGDKEAFYMAGPKLPTK